MDELPEAVIFDVDGTLCDVRPIRHYVEGPTKNFDAFHKASALCDPNWDVVEDLRRQVELERAIIVVTGRSFEYRPLTIRWLRGFDIHFDEIHTRPSRDFRKDAVIKKEILDRLRIRYTIVGSWDDNPSVIEEVWEAEGIPTTVVPGWGA